MVGGNLGLIYFTSQKPGILARVWGAPVWESCLIARFCAFSKMSKFRNVKIDDLLKLLRGVRGVLVRVQVLEMESNQAAIL